VNLPFYTAKRCFFVEDMEDEDRGKGDLADETEERENSRLLGGRRRGPVLYAGVKPGIERAATM